MKLGAYALIWLSLYFAPMYAPQFWDTHFNLFQSTIPFTLLLATTVLMLPGWIRRSMMSVLILQVVLNAVDALFSLTAAQYNSTQSVLNSIELMLIFLWGAGEWENYAKRRWHTPDSVNRGPNHPKRVRPHA